MEIRTCFSDISHQLYAFSWILIQNDDAAVSIVVDAFQAFLLEEGELILDHDNPVFSANRMLQDLMFHIFRIATARSGKDLASKAVVFLKHKSDFDLNQIGEIVSLGKKDLLSQLNYQRSQMVENYNRLGEYTGKCRLTWNILARFDLGSLTQRNENHLQGCYSCQEAIANMTSLHKQIGSLLEYSSLSSKQREKIMSQVEVILQNFELHAVRKEKKPCKWWIGLVTFLDVLISKQMIALYLLFFFVVISIKLFS